MWKSEVKGCAYSSRNDITPVSAEIDVLATVRLADCCFLQSWLVLACGAAISHFAVAFGFSGVLDVLCGSFNSASVQLPDQRPDVSRALPHQL